MSIADYDMTHLKQDECVNINVDGGYFVITKTDVGYVMDFYDITDECHNTMTVWNDDLPKDEVES